MATSDWKKLDPLKGKSFEKNGIRVWAYERISGGDIMHSELRTDYKPLKDFNSANEFKSESKIDKMMNLVDRHREKGFYLTDREEELLIKLVKEINVEDRRFDVKSALENPFPLGSSYSYLPSDTLKFKYAEGSPKQKLWKMGLIEKVSYIGKPTFGKNEGIPFYQTSITEWGLAWLDRSGVDVLEILDNIK